MLNRDTSMLLAPPELLQCSSVQHSIVMISHTLNRYLKGKMNFPASYN
jgi:hypothetical protein